MGECALAMSSMLLNFAIMYANTCYVAGYLVSVDSYMNLQVRLLPHHRVQQWLTLLALMFAATEVKLVAAACQHRGVHRWAVHGQPWGSAHQVCSA